MFGQTDAAPAQNYQVLARRSRPQSFVELVGQEVIAESLSSMISSKRIPHAFLFTGTRGVGKTSSARILAKSLCCEKGPTLSPCQTCVHCKQITACAHDDVLEIDGASNTGVDNIRELRESARFYPTSGRYKIFIIDEVHMLSQGAFNALLKTLEEPPAQVVFILATTELHKVPVTVRSRCMVFSFRKVEASRIAEHLKKLLSEDNISFDEDSINLVAREAKGSIRDSLSLIEQVIAVSGGESISFEKTRNALGVLGADLAEGLFLAISAKNPANALNVVQNADANSVDLSVLLEDTAQLFRAALIFKEIADAKKAQKLTQLLPRETKLVVDATQALSASALSEVFKILSLGSKEVSKVNAALSWAEIVVMDATSRADWLSSEELLGYLKTPGLSTAVHKQPSLEVAQPLQIATPLPPKPLVTQAAPENKPEIKNPWTTSEALPKAIEHTHTPLDISGFAKVVKYIEGKSLQLSAKLKHASLDSFNPTLIQFANIPQNKIFTQMTVSDAQLFLEALAQLGFQDAELKGIDLPKGVIKASQQKSKDVQQSIQPNNNSGVQNSSDKLIQKSEPLTMFKKYQNVDPFAEKKSSETAPSVSSIAQHERVAKDQDRTERENRINNFPAIKKLREMSTSLEFVPIEDDADEQI